MFLAIILLLVSFATASPALDDLPTSWQCHQFEQSVGEVPGVLELVTPLKPAFSAPAVSEVLFSPPFLQNWQLSVVGSGSISLLDGRVLVVDPASLGGAVILETTAVALEAPMAPSGRHVVVGQPLDLQAIDTTTWDSMPVPVVGEVVRMRFSPGADHLALALLDGTVEVWDIGGTPNRLATLEDALVGAPVGMAFSPSADRLAVAQMDGGVVILGFEDGNLFNVATTQVPDHTHTSISSGT
ncbi:WD40 repeat domain-containing protein, partial [bacterium]|nr:WD40 repeat domain-containing protein [bacterium]